MDLHYVCGYPTTWRTRRRIRAQIRRDRKAGWPTRSIAVSTGGLTVLLQQQSVENFRRWRTTGVPLVP